MVQFYRSLLMASLCTLTMIAQQATEPPPAAVAERRPFCRFLEREDGGQLEVLLATYQKRDAIVTLHASLHVADPEHYAELQRRFERFDALLYELVADEDLRPHPGMELDSDGDWVTMLQAGLGRGMQLADQCECLDYRKPNFVHADMTAEEFEAALERAGKSVFGELLTGGFPEVDREAEGKLRRIDVVAAFRSGRGAHEMRVLGARLMAEPDGQGGEATVVIEGRNEKCLEVLQQQLAAGKKSIGIYYGAAHMEHVERRLKVDMGFELRDEQWIVAWDCAASRFPVVVKGEKQRRYRARRDIEALTAAIDAFYKQHPGVEPTWRAVRAAQSSGKLPGLADGMDPWGREYGLAKGERGYKVCSAGGDGVVGNADDVTVEPTRSEELKEKLEALKEELEVAQEQGKRLTARKGALTLQSSVLAYCQRPQRFPASLGELTKPDASGAVHLTEIPKDPWGNDYFLFVRGAGDQTELEVWSCGPDGLRGTGDDIGSASSD